MVASAEQPYLGFQPGLSDREWEFVHELIRDLETEERQKRFLSAFFVWKTVVRAFRRVEFRRMRETRPDEKDLRYHALTLSSLVALGEALAMDLSEMEDRRWVEGQGIRREDLEASLGILKANWTEWHSEKLPERVEALRERIFNGWRRAYHPAACRLV